MRDSVSVLDFLKMLLVLTRNKLIKPHNRTLVSPNVEARYTGSGILLENESPNHRTSSGMVGVLDRGYLYQEPWATKFFVSFLFAFSAIMGNSVATIIAHDRCPDRKQYPPLPDLVLDNLSYVPWAFEVCEGTMIVLFFTFLTMLAFHKYRFIVLRRVLVIIGSVYILRCFLLTSTSLSIPSTDIPCDPKVGGGFWSTLERAKQIYLMFGLKLLGIQTCGDLMFSGHTTVVTVMCFAIREYTPEIRLLHFFSWVLNIVAMIFILASHQHYTIDVIVAFLITSGMFLYYHLLASHRVIAAGFSSRTKTWFPLFGYLESALDTIVPNEFEAPWTSFTKWAYR